MPVPDERIARYRRRRQERLQGVSALRSALTRGDAQAWYRAGELLVVDDERRHVERYLAARGREITRLGDEPVIPGFRRYLTTGLDVPQAIQAVHGELPSGARVACPNHVFFSTPFNHGGPFGPPVPADASPLPPRRSDTRLVSVAIIDTGLWKDSQIPEVYFKPGGFDVEVETDVDGDGVLDGDVGHANFIAGVIVLHTRRVELSVLKVLDTFGVCTEDELVKALDRLDPSVQLVNLSLGGFTLDSGPPLPLQAALERALTGTDRVVVAAAGNNGERVEPFWPAAFTTTGHAWSERVAAVAAHDGWEVCEWSNAGPWITLAAPGQDVRSTYINHPEFPSGWAQWSGTSFAAPRVVAEVAKRIGQETSALAALQQVVASASVSFGGYPGLT
ncbi:MAG TPA: S8/S53 family peptidase [Natronosporangium sp.]|nr:S8/S53 family peptidase [Natronosporangium sp.]